MSGEAPYYRLLAGADGPLNDLSLFRRETSLIVQIDTNSGVKRETSAGNASLSQLLLTSPFSSSDGARFTPNDVLGQPTTNPAVMSSSAAPAGEVGRKWFLDNEVCRVSLLPG